MLGTKKKKCTYNVHNINTLRAAFGFQIQLFMRAMEFLVIGIPRLRSCSAIKNCIYIEQITPTMCKFTFVIMRLHQDDRLTYVTLYGTYVTF